MATKEQFDVDIEQMCSEIEKKADIFNLILFNDNTHSMGQVVRQLLKAVKCNSPQAMGFMKEAHNTGSAIVMSDSLEECQKAQRILEEIFLATRIEKI